MCAAFVAAAARALFAGAAEARRIVLVIGNSAYTFVAPLDNPGIGKPDEISAERLSLIRKCDGKTCFTFNNRKFCA